MQRSAEAQFSVLSICVFLLQLDLPHRERDKGFLLLGLGGHLQWSRILSRPESHTRGERQHTDRATEQPLAGQRNQSSLHRLLHLQREHQLVLRHHVRSITVHCTFTHLLIPIQWLTKVSSASSGWWLNSQRLVEQSLPTRSEQSNWFAT